MRDYLRVLALLRPYRARVATLALCIVLASVLSSVGITFVSPLLRILFLDQPDPAGVEHSISSIEADSGAPEFSDPSPEAPVGEVPLPPRVSRIKERVERELESRIYQGSRRDQLFRVTVLLFVLYFLKNLFGFAQGALSASLEHRAIFDIRERLYDSIQRLPLAFFSQERTGYMMSRVIIDVDMMRGSIVGCAAQMVSNGVMILIALTVVFWWSWQLSLATFLIVPPNMLLVALISKKLRKGSHRAQEAMGDLASVLQETIAGIRVVKAFNMEEAEAHRYRQRNRRYYKSYVKVKILEALSSPVSEVLGVTTAVIVLGFGGHLVLTGRLRPDLLLAFLAMMLWVIGPIKNLIKVNSTLQQSLAAARRVFTIMDGEREAEAEDGRRDLEGVRQEIRFDGVGFAYRADTPVLSDIDLHVRAGQVVAFVGASGAGKSTLVDLIPRFHRPTSGRIEIDGINLQEIHLGTLRGLIGMVTQEVILFHDSVANNIGYGSPGASREKIEAAARAANAHEFIASLPEGYDTTVGERGTQLSGGQRQRLAIARAILKDPPILIFDEATSALDTESERLVQEAMERLMKGRTTFVIAHRLSTVTRADRIVVMDRGRIVETGRHEELVEKRGAYRRLYDLQFQV